MKTTLKLLQKKATQLIGLKDKAMTLDDYREQIEELKARLSKKVLMDESEFKSVLFNDDKSLRGS